MKIPSREELERNKVHLEWLNIHGEWKRFDSFYDLATARKLGYKSTKTIYRLLNRDLLEDYVYLEKSGRVYLMQEPPNLPTLAEKIRRNIQFRSKNIIKRCY